MASELPRVTEGYRVTVPRGIAALIPEIPEGRQSKPSCWEGCSARAWVLLTEHVLRNLVNRCRSQDKHPLSG